MKQTIYIAIILPICLGLGNPVIAFENYHFKKDFSASIGLKTWINEWEYPILLTTNNNYMVRTQHSDTTEFAFIPTLNLRYKKFFVSGSYLPDTNYSFETQNIDLVDKEIYIGTIAAQFNATRSEWDINLGYYILPSLIVTAGYKNINREFDINLNDKQFPNVVQPFLNVGKTDTSGFTLGFAGVAPLRGQFGLYGSFAYGWLKTEKNISSNFKNVLGQQYGNFDVKYYLGEFGLTYFSKLENIHTLEAASIYMGYRFQALNEERGSLDNNGRPLEVTDTTSGFVFGVNLSF